MFPVNHSEVTMTKFASVVVLFVVIMLSANASAQTTGFAEVQFHVVDGQLSTTMDASTDTKLGGGWSLQSWTLKSAGWSELQIGIGKSLASWASVSASVGIEESDGLWRTGYSLWLGGRGKSALVLYELGDSGYWLKIVATQQIRKSLKVGVLSQRFVGTGPYAEVKLGQLKVWATVPVVDGKGVLTGVRMFF